jgi:hypothetical protein
MKRFLRIFALLMAASMLLWIAGCGDDDDDDDEDTTPPAFISSVPAEGAVDIAGNAVVTFTFDEDIATATLVSGGTGVVAAVGTAVTFTPGAGTPLGPGPVTLTISAEDAAGNATTATVNFTAKEPDPDPPVLDGPSCVPKDGASGVDPAGMTELVIAANEDLSDARVLSTDPEFNFTDEVAGKLVTLTFLQWSPPNETTVTVELEMTDLAGNPGTVTYSFTTMAKEE